MERVSELNTRRTGSSTAGSGRYHLGIEVDAEADMATVEVDEKRRDAARDGRGSRRREVDSRVADLEAINVAFGRGKVTVSDGEWSRAMIQVRENERW